MWYLRWMVVVVAVLIFEYGHAFPFFHILFLCLYCNLIGRSTHKRNLASRGFDGSRFDLGKYIFSFPEDTSVHQISFMAIHHPCFRISFLLTFLLAFSVRAKLARHSSMGKIQASISATDQEATLNRSLNSSFLITLQTSHENMTSPSPPSVKNPPPSNFLEILHLISMKSSTYLEKCQQP